jgi:molybdopterin/thiamine biosynthesis adenylyltransferase
MISYDKIFSRNIGLITQEEQNQLKNAKVLICGVGGMGGVAAEILVRMGIGSIKIIDPDTYDFVNFNRQLHSNIGTVDRYKVDVLKENFLKINPFLNIEAYPDPVNETNVESLLMDIDVVINGMDVFLPSIILERLAHSKQIPIVDAWITPFASVFVIKGSDPHWEEYLNLATKNKQISEITPQDLEKNLRIEVDYTFSFFNPYDYISKDLVEKVITKEVSRPSFPIVVFLSGTFMANEVFKLICGYQTTDFKGIFFNQYTYEVKKMK